MISYHSNNDTYFSFSFYFSFCFVLFKGIRLGLLVSRTYTGFDKPCRKNEFPVKGKHVDNCTDNDVKVKYIDDNNNNNNDNDNDNNNDNDDNDSDDNDNDNNNDYNDESKNNDGHQKNSNHHKTSMKRICCNFDVNHINVQKSNTIKKGNNKNNSKQDINHHEMSEVTIRWLVDIYDTYTPTNPIKSNEKSFCLTDGCGFISLDLALQLPSCIRQGIRIDRIHDKSEISTKNYCNTSKTKNGIKNKINKNDNGTVDDNEEEGQCKTKQNMNFNLKNPVCVPSAFQVRIMCPFGIFKGTLVTHTALPPNTIIVRDSMHKVQGPKSGKYDHQSTNIDEINRNRIKLSNVDIKEPSIPLHNIDGNMTRHSRINNEYDGVVFNSVNAHENEKEKENEIDDEKLLIEYEKIMEAYNKQRMNNKSINNENIGSREGGTWNLDSPSTRSTMSTISLQIVNTANPLKQYRCNLNKHLILLLHNLGVPFHIFESKLR